MNKAIGNKKIYVFISFLTILIFSSCKINAQETKGSPNNITGPFFGQNPKAVRKVFVDQIEKPVQEQTKQNLEAQKTQTTTTSVTTTTTPKASTQLPPSNINSATSPSPSIQPGQPTSPPAQTVQPMSTPAQTGPESATGQPQDVIRGY